jgi:cytochrome P450
MVRGALIQLNRGNQTASCMSSSGDVVHAKALDKHIIVLNTLEATNDLLEKRSSKYSSRSRLPMVNELYVEVLHLPNKRFKLTIFLARMGWTWALPNMEYGASWREHRKALHQYFHPAASLRYRLDQLNCTRRMLRDLLESPDDCMQIVRLCVNSLFSQMKHSI